MKVVILGPVCRDENIVNGKNISMAGGTTYYTGNALNSLEVKTTVLCTLSEKDIDILDSFPREIIISPIFKEETIVFRNIYNNGVRMQKAFVPENTITKADIDIIDFSVFDYIILGPLFYDNIPLETVEFLSRFHRKIIISGQGYMRHLEGEKIVLKEWKNKEKFVSKTDMLFLDEAEIMLIGKETIEENADILLDMGLKRLIVTKNKKGSEIFESDRRIDIPAYAPKPLTDETGAGDTYLAAFLKGLEMFPDNLEKAGKFAAMAATICIEKEGPVSGTFSEIMSSINKRWKTN